MKYRILWLPDAEENLAKILDDEGRLKFLLGDTVRMISQKLMWKPHAFGESREAGYFVGFVQPLAISYQIHDDVRTVVVIGIWRTDRR